MRHFQFFYLHLFLSFPPSLFRSPSPSPSFSASDLIQAARAFSLSLLIAQVLNLTYPDLHWQAEIPVLKGCQCGAVTVHPP